MTPDKQEYRLDKAESLASKVMWSRSEVVAALRRTRELLDEPHTPLSELADCVRRIPGCEEAIRRRANASQRGLPHAIRSLEHALAFIGLGECRKIVQEGGEGTLDWPAMETEISRYRESA